MRYLLESSVGGISPSARPWKTMWCDWWECPPPQFLSCMTVRPVDSRDWLMMKRQLFLLKSDCLSMGKNKSQLYCSRVRATRLMKTSWFSSKPWISLIKSSATKRSRSSSQEGVHWKPNTIKFSANVTQFTSVSTLDKYGCMQMTTPRWLQQQTSVSVYTSRHRALTSPWKLSICSVHSCHVWP